MSSKLGEYLDQLARALERRKIGDTTGEERSLERMDRLWYEMSVKDRATVDDLGARMARGEVSDDDFIRERRRSISTPTCAVVARVRSLQLRRAA